MPRFDLENYNLVPDRVKAFRERYPIESGWGVECAILADDGNRVLMIATITDPDGRIVGQGHAEEIRGAGMVNKTSAIENCETSALGRALAACGFCASGQYASAEEIDKAKRTEEYLNKNKPKITEEPQGKLKVEGKLTADDATKLSKFIRVLTDTTAGLTKKQSGEIVKKVTHDITGQTNPRKVADEGHRSAIVNGVRDHVKNLKEA